MTTGRITLASRQSPLAMRQAQCVADALHQQYNLDIRIVGISTQGDEVLNRPLAHLGGKELFIKRLQDALLAGEADAAVHSLKDMSARKNPDFCLAAVGFAEDVRDAVVTADGEPLLNLAPGAVIGTSSPRRTALLKRYFPALRPVSIRGNIHSRLDKLASGRYQALLLAAAGLKRMNLQQHITEYLSPKQFIPAVGQGLLAIECLSTKQSLIDFLTAINNDAMMYRAQTERAFAAAMGGNCTTPLGAYAQTVDGQTTLRTFYADPIGRYFDATLDVTKPEATGQKIAADMLQQIGQLHHSEN